MNKSKKLEAAGILLIISTVSNILFEFAKREYYALNYHYLRPIDWFTCIALAITTLMISLYCFSDQKVKKTKIFGIIGFALLALFRFIWVCSYFRSAYQLQEQLHFSFGELFLTYYLFPVISLAVAVFMTLAVIKLNRSIAIVGTAIFFVYSILVCTTLVNGITDFLNDPLSLLHYVTMMNILLFLLFSITQCISYLIFWWFHAESALKQQPALPTPEVDTSIESQLHSLRQRYESGTISEEEYNQKKSELLNKF